MKKLFVSLSLWMIIGLKPAVAEVCSYAVQKLFLQPQSQSAKNVPTFASRVDAQITWPHLQAAFARLKSKVHELELQNLDHEASSLKIQLVVRQFVFWDTLQLQVDFPKLNTIRLRLRDNWIPANLILDRIRSRLEALKSPVGLNITQAADQLEIQIQTQALDLQSPAFHMEPAEFELGVANDGTLLFSLSTGHFHEASSSRPMNVPMVGKTALCGQAEQVLSNPLMVGLELNLSPEALAPMVLSGEKLSDRLQSAKGQITLETMGKLRLEPFSYQAAGTLALHFEQLQIENKRYQHVEAIPFKLSYTYPDQLSIFPDLPAPVPVAPSLRPSRLTLFADGPAYFEEIMKSIAGARETVAQEVFSLHDGQTTRALAQLLVKKAIGMQDGANGAVADAASPEGVKVYLLHNHGLKAQGAEEVLHFFQQAQDEVFSHLHRLPPAQLQRLQERLRQNLRITALTDGPAWADHRKLLVIDGKIGYVGGRNWGDSYFTNDSFRDQMVRVEGPTVRQMQQALITNWNALNPAQPLVWPLKSETELAAGLPAGAHLSPAAILTTSHRAWEIESALLKTINEARHEIRIEHAYIYHEPIEAALRAAKARGVNIRLLFSERSDESVFERVNPATAIKLIQAPGKGLVDCWLYQGPGGKDDYMVHTKFLSADGRIAVAGSANLIPRSLHSPFTAEGVPLLFNEEIVIYIDDPVFVGQMNREIFEKRIEANGRKVGIPELQALIDARGGGLRLLVEKLKGLLS